MLVSEEPVSCCTLHSSTFANRVSMLHNLFLAHDDAPLFGEDALLGVDALLGDADVGSGSGEVPPPSSPPLAPALPHHSSHSATIMEIAIPAGAAALCALLLGGLFALRKWRRRRRIALLWQQHIQDNSSAGGYAAFQEQDERVTSMRV